ncbi:MAG: ABC transporter permease [Candidatus Nanopelagicales bacterium]|nr:ABC transporter permease [Candidatus Nanopelagicales bacterium]MDZ4250115.1 ABC transporter permease [Candidatus Nanopelagicales bacterium]
MTGALLRLALRRDRVLLPAWLVGLTLMVVFSVSATKDLYPDDEFLETASETINATPALVALYGKIYDTSSLGATSLIKLTAFGSALVAILFVFLVVRHSRAEEESGRQELVAAGAVTRRAPLEAALLLGMAGSGALGVLTAVGLGLLGLPWTGALAFGADWALSGIVFSAVAGVAAQVTTSARAAIGIGVASVGIAYLLRAVGDLAPGDPGWASWLSPIGWSQQIRPFAGNRWWVTLIPLAATAALVAAAFVLRYHRDMGSGLIADRPGPDVGRIGSVAGLAWRLHRGAFLAWLVGAVLMGAVLGSIVDNISGLLESPQLREYLELLGGRQALTEAFLAAEVGVLGALMSAYGISATSRLRSEESAGHAESLLSTMATRQRWAASHFCLALVAIAALMLLTGAAVGLTHGLAVGDPVGQTMRLAVAGVAQVPAAWVVASIVMLLFGVIPRWVPVAWGLLAAFVALGEFGVLWGLPRWVLDLSPFAHSPRLPGGSIDAAQLVGLVAVAAVLAVAGFATWRRRDVQGL